MIVAGKIVEWGTLFEMVYQALGAALAIAFAFSLAVAGSTRFADEVRENRMTRAALFGVLAAIGLAVCLAGIVMGIVVMTSKG